MSRKKSYNRIGSLILTFAILFSFLGIETPNLSAQTTDETDVVSPQQVVVQAPSFDSEEIYAGETVIGIDAGRGDTVHLEVVRDGVTVESDTVDATYGSGNLYVASLQVGDVLRIWSSNANGESIVVDTTVVDASAIINLVVNPITKGDSVITGTVNPEASKVQAGSSYMTYDVAADGSFTITSGGTALQDFINENDEILITAVLDGVNHRQTVPVITPEPVVVEAPSFDNEEIYAGETVIGIDAGRGDTVHLEVVRDGTVVDSDTVDATYGSGNLYVASLQAGDVLRIWSSNANGESIVVQTTVEDASAIINLVVNPITKGDSVITGTVNPEASKVQAGSSYMTFDVAADGSFTITSGGTALQDFINENDEILITAVLDGVNHRQTVPVLAAPHTVTIDANGGTIDAEAATTEVVDGETFTVPYAFRTNLERAGHSLVGYSVEGTLLDADGVVVTEVSKFPADYTVGSDVTLTAIWEVSNGSLDLEVHDEEPSTQADRYTVTLTTEDGTVYTLTTSSRGSEHARWEVEDLPNGVYTLAIDGYTITSGEKTGGDRETVGSIDVNDDGTAVLNLTYADDASSAFARFDIHGEVVRPAAPEIEVFSQDTHLINIKSDPNVTVEMTFADSTVLEDTANRWGNSGFNFRELGVWPAIEVGDVVTAVAIDENGVRSDVASFTVPDAYEITGLTVDPIYPSESGSTITGTVNPEARITVHFPNGNQAATVDEEGNWTIGSAGRNLVEGTLVSLSVVLDGETYRFSDVFETVAAPLTVTLDANGGTMNDEYVSTEVAAGETYTVPYTFQSLLAREGHTLTGYTVEGTLLDADGVAVTEISKYTAEFTPESDVTLTAVWEVTNGKFQIDLHDDEPATQADRYIVTLTSEDGTVHNLTTSSRGSEHASWEVEDVANGTYTLAIDGFAITEAVKNGHPDTVSTFTVNEDGTATVELTFEDEANSTFIRYDVQGEVQNVAEAPAAPEMTLITPLDYYVSGNAEVGNTVVVLDSEGNEIGRTEVVRTPSWQVNLPEGQVHEVGDIYSAYQIDAVTGLESELAEVTVVDDAAITQLTIDPVYVGDTSVSGTVNPEAESVTVRIDGATRSTRNIDEEGNWSVNVYSDLSDAVAGDTLDVQPRIDGKTFRYEDNAEVLALVAPRIATISDEDTSLSIVAPNEGDLVRITLPNGEVIEEVAKRFGRVPVILDAPLTAGEVVTAVTYSPNGGVSEEATATVIVASEQFEFALNPIYEGDEYITGTATPGSQVFVRNLGGRNVTADADGNFSIRLFAHSSDLVEGFEVEFQVRVNDKTYGAGTEVVQALEAPRIATISDEDTSLSIVAPNEGDLVRITLPSGEVIEEVAKRFGRVPVILDAPLTAGEVVTAVTYSPNGGVSEEATATVIVASEQFDLAVDPIYEGDVYITGTATPGSQVFVRNLGGRNVTADEDGSFSIRLFAHSEDLVEGFEVEFQVRVDGKTYDAGTVEVLALPNVAEILVAEPGTRLVSGTATPGARIRLRVTAPDGTNTSSARVVGEDGTFSIEYSPNFPALADGFVVDIEDRDDNSRILDTLTIEVPNVAEILVAEPGTRLVSGTATPGARIRLRVSAPDGTSTSSARVVGEDGTFSIEYSVNFPALADGFVVDIEDRDDNSRILDTLTIEVPNVAEILVAEPGTRLVSGTATPGARIRLRVSAPDGTSTSSARVVGEDGTFSIEYSVNFPALADGFVVDIEDRDDNSRILDTLTIVEAGPVDLDNSTIIVTRLGAYGSRYYQAQLRLVDANGVPVEGLTQEDFEIIGFGGISNFQAEGNYYRLDTVSADELRPEYTVSMVDGVITIEIVEDKAALEIVEVDETFDGVEDFNLTTNGDVDTLEEVVVVVNGERIVLTPEQYTAVSGSTVLTIPAEVLNELGITVGDTFTVEVTQGEGEDHLAGTVSTEVTRVLPVYTLGVEIRDLDNSRTTEVTFTVTNADGEVAAGNFNEYGQWLSTEELPEGVYTITVETPEGIVAVVNDTVSTQAAVATNVENVFMMNLNEETKGTLTAVYAALILVEETEEVDTTALEEAIAEAEAVVREDFTPETVANLEAALEDARAVLANPDATQDEVDAATEALLEAIAGLVPVETEVPGEVDTSALEEAIERAEAVDTENFTPETVANLETALEEARAVLANPDATQDEVDAATQALLDAIAGLVPVETESTTTPDGTTVPEEPTPSEDDTDGTTTGEGVTQTGESSTPFMFAVLALMMAAGLVVISILRRRNS